MHDVAWRGRWIYVRSKDAQKQLARTPLNYKHTKVLPQQGETAKARNEEPVKGQPYPKPKQHKTKEHGKFSLGWINHI